MYEGKQVGAIIPAAGTGSRMQSGEKKQFMLLRNREILEWTLVNILKEAIIDVVWVVVPKEVLVSVEEKIIRWQKAYGFPQLIHVVEGGSNRQESVHKALKCIPDPIEWIVVHDGVRPFVDIKWLYRNLKYMADFDSIVSALPSTDTLKIVDADNVVQTTLNREEIWGVQTPQVFKHSELRKVHDRASKDRFVGTDDASLMEKYDYKVLLCEGEKSNIKITTPMDLIFGQAILDWLSWE
ncbi:MAG: 2-C-methyl-D-erythritol 4-phosphate cytidylyltransferase [Clostridia bacterium]|nr:2-C-methyl-D-erythritol 4-phosphate cytidylyltransferase [Clostridia bacterium]